MARRLGRSPTLRRQGWWWGGALAMLVAGVIFTGLRVVAAAHEMRALYRELGDVQSEQNTLAAEQSRLMLEGAAMSSMQNIEQIARSELDMVFPKQVAQVLE